MADSFAARARLVLLLCLAIGLAGTPTVACRKIDLQAPHEGRQQQEHLQCGGDHLIDTELTGSNIDTFLATSSGAGACCEACAAFAPLCRAWSWHSATGRCALKTGPGSPAPSAGFVSGTLPLSLSNSTAAAVAKSELNCAYDLRICTYPLSEEDCKTWGDSTCPSLGATCCDTVYDSSTQRCCVEAQVMEASQ